MLEPRVEDHPINELFYQPEGIALAQMYAVMHQDPRAPRELDASIPESVDRMIMRALAKNPAERFQSCEEMAAALLSEPAEPSVTHDL